MKQLYRWRLALCVLFGLTLSFPVHIFAEESAVSYSIIQQNLYGEVAADGSASFIDRFTYDINEMRSTTFRLETEGYNVKHYAVGVQTEDADAVRPYTESYTGVPETYRVSLGSDYLDFTVYHMGENELVDIVFEYTLEGAITNYLDTAALFRLVVGSQTPFERAFSGEIVLPGTVTNPANLNGWVQGVPEATLSLFEDEETSRSVIKINIPTLAANQPVEVNAIFPTSLTPNNPVFVEEQAKETIVAAQDLQLEEDLTAYKHQLSSATFWMVLAMVVGLALVLLSFLYYWASRRKLNPNPVTLPEYHNELPTADITPAIMATYILRTRPNGADFVATIVDLARKGYLVLEEARKEKRGVLAAGQSMTLRITLKVDAPSINALHTHERQVLNYVSPDGAGVSITLEEIEARLKQSKDFRKQQLLHWKKFNDYSELRGIQLRGGKSKQATRSSSLSWIAVGGTILAGTVSIYFATRLGGTSLIALAILLTLMTVLASVGMVALNIKRPIMTAEYDLARQQWNGFGRLLADCGKFDMAEMAPLKQWEEYLSYAVSLGVADNLLYAMKNQFKRKELGELNLDAKMYTNPTLIGNVLPQSIMSTLATIDPSGQNTGMGSNNNEE